MKKSDIRKEMLGRRRALPAEEISQKSKMISNKAIALLEQRQIKSLLAYWPIHGEVEVKEILAYCSHRGIQVYLPIVVGENQMTVGRYCGKTALKKGKWGILEPEDRAENAHIELALIPGVAFSKKMYRIGYGKGYFDRYLSQHSHIWKLALAYEFQMLEEIEVESHDIQMDMILTERETYIAHPEDEKQRRERG